MTDTKKKINQIKAIAKELEQADPSMAIIIMVDNKKEQAGYVSGKAINLAAGLAYIMREADGFSDAVKAAVDAYENVL